MLGTVRRVLAHHQAHRGISARPVVPGDRGVLGHGAPGADPETVLHSIEEVRGRREKAREFIEECVPIFAAALDEAGGGNDDSGDASYHGSVEPADRVMRAVERSNLRSGPGIGHDRVGLLDVGDEVRVTGVVGDWFRIEPPGGGEAFIYGPLLAEAPAPVTAWAEPAPEAPGLPADADPAPDTSRASSPDYMRFKAWTQPFCVAGNGAITMIPLADFYEAIDREICVGVVDIHKTATCDTRTAQCDWPCGGDPRCRNEWEVEPQWPYAGYADEARAVAEAAGEDPETMRADGLAKVREYPGKFLADTRVDADPPPTRGEPETPAVTAADSGQAGGLHGSIAFSQDDDGAYAWGIAWSFDSSAGAQSEALGQCREYGGTRCAEGRVVPGGLRGARDRRRQRLRDRLGCHDGRSGARCAGAVPGVQRRLPDRGRALFAQSEQAGGAGRDGQRRHGCEPRASGYFRRFLRRRVGSHLQPHLERGRVATGRTQHTDGAQGRYQGKGGGLCAENMLRLFQPLGVFPASCVLRGRRSEVPAAVRTAGGGRSVCRSCT